MPPKRKAILTRKHLLIAAVIILGMITVGWFAGRFPLARWAVRRALAAGGLDHATFQIDSVGLGSVRIANLSIGSAPWLTADGVKVTFTLGELLDSRVGTLRFEGARWTVTSRDGLIDWGYVPRPRAGTGTLDLRFPLDLIEISDSVIRVVIDGVPHDLELAGRIAPAGPGAIAGQIDLVALGRAATLTAQVQTHGPRLTVDINGHADSLSRGAPGPAGPTTTAGSPSFTPDARWHAALVREQAGSPMRVNLDLTLDSISEEAAGVQIAVSRANISAAASVAEGSLSTLTATISARALRAGDFTLHFTEITATKAEGPNVDLDLAATGDGWELPAAHGRVRWETSGDGTEASPSSTTFTTSAQTDAPVSLELDSAGITGLVESVAAAARVQWGDSGFHLLDGRVALNGGSLQAGDLAVSDAHAEAVMRDPETIEVSSLSAIVGDGSTISAEPFTWNPGTPRVEARLNMNNLSLAHWLPIITSKHATGEGRVNGTADVGIDWSAGTVKLTQLQGSLSAVPERGYIQVTDADALGGLLEKQDPRFATDEVMRGVRDKIIAAMRDFAFNKLTVELSRQGDHTIALTYLSGFGRHGKDPQGLNLTLDLHAQDSFVDLASRIAAKSRVRKAAGKALDEFFQETPTQEKQ
ncbi:MAG: hypothetical protein H7Y88_12150 [Phycisphaerales bacterium]|nr:hypothetical protein [Phycisphaerales bacterium]